ncbi:DUF551 domain-containing protein [Acinetobacter baumannii]|uniref:DUF551 domain-containing protein n=1 Tax=Acinetobacter baumannii TaxID=470 RepID=UPI0020CCC8C4|nr:DUF551 domain-containing protein [Acinetobacter baumannii]MCQ1053793.1 DUF551 domain-containing protein [Acinetobacter baumannii]
MTDLNKEREVFEELPQFKYQLEVCEWNEEQGLYINESGDPDFEYFADACNGGLTAFLTQREEIARLKAELEKAKAQAVPTWISVKDEEPPTDTMVLICWSDSSDVQPEIDYMTCDEDLNHIWANFEIDPPTHWMYFHKVPSESGAEG